MPMLAVFVAATAPVCAQDIWQAELGTDEVHPCLAFTRAGIPLMRERIERRPYSTYYQAVGGGPRPVARAFAWAFDRDEQAAEEARLLLLRMDPDGYHCACGTGTPMQVFAEAYDLLFDYPGLSDDDHRYMRAKLASACERMYLSALETGAGQHPGNQRVRGLSGLGTAALVLRGYTDAAHTPQEWLQRALDGIRDEANLLFFRPDGMYVEGPGYAAFTMSLMITFARYYERNCGKWLFDEPCLRNAVQYLVYITQPDGYTAALGTTNMLNAIGQLRPVIGVGPVADQRFYRWAMDQWSSVDGGTWRDIMSFDDTVTPATQGFPPTRFFPTSQEAHFRSEWSKNAVAMWLKGKDPLLARSYHVYSHGDVASFVLHAYGELLAVDAGYDHWVSYDLYPPELHNCLLVDGKGPVNGTAGLLRNALNCPLLDAADIQTGYEGIEHTRTAVFADKSYFIITDDIAADSQHTYEWQLHSPVTRDKGEIAIDGNSVSWTGFDPVTELPGDVTLQTVFAGPVDIQPMEKSRWQPFGADPKTGSYDNWAIVARRQAAGCRYLTVLYPRPSEATRPPIETPDVDGGLCAVVGGGDSRDIVLAPDSGATVAYGGILTTCSTAVVRTHNGRPVWLYARGPGRVEHAGELLVALGEQGQCATAVSFDVGGPRRLYLSTDPDAETSPDITLPQRVDQASVLHRGANGRWTAVEAEVTAGEVSFIPPPGADATRTFLVADAESPSMGDTSAPEIVAVSIGGQQQDAVAELDLGRVSRAPKDLCVEFADAESSVDVAGVRAAVNGYPAQARADRDADGRRVRVSVDLSGLGEPRHYTVCVTAPDSAAEPNRAVCTLRFSTAPLLVDGGFELGAPGLKHWGLGAWSSTAETKYDMHAVAENPHSGSQCLMMKGIAGGLNLCAAQRVDLEAGAEYEFRGYCRGDVPFACSMLSDDGKTEYLTSPAFSPASEWSPFAWRFKVSLPGSYYLIVLRHGSVGTAWFDDVELTSL